MSKILILDIETTGFLNQGGKIVELGIVELDLESEAVRLSKALRIDLDLKGQDLVFENKIDCINHHTKNY